MTSQHHGTPWQGNVPAHWTVQPIGAVLMRKKKKLSPELPAGAISFGEVVFKNEDSVPESTRATYQEVLPGDVLVNPLNLNYDLKSLRIALSTIAMCVSPGYFVMQPRDSVHPKYLSYALREFDVMHMKTLGAGIRQTVTYDLVAKEQVALPPRAEQERIANYLDAKTAAIDALIAKKELLIEELKKYQEAVIAEAVKPREGWSAYKVKQLFKALPKSSLPSGAGEDAGSFMFYVSGEETKRISEAMHSGTALLLADGGKATLHLAEGAFSWSDHVVCLVSTDSATTELVYNQLSVQRDLLDAQGFRGTGLPMLDKRWLYEDLSVWLPSSRAEALRLNAEIRTVREATRRLTTNARATVQELKSYRASLISEAVTGKLTLPD